MLWSLDDKKQLSLSKLDSEEQLEYLIKDNQLKEMKYCYFLDEQP